MTAIVVPTTLVSIATLIQSSVVTGANGVASTVASTVLADMCAEHVRCSLLTAQLDPSQWYRRLDCGQTCRWTHDDGHRHGLRPGCVFCPGRDIVRACEAIALTTSSPDAADDTSKGSNSNVLVIALASTGSALVAVIAALIVWRCLRRRRNVAAASAVASGSGFGGSQFDVRSGSSIKEVKLISPFTLSEEQKAALPGHAQHTLAWLQTVSDAPPVPAQTEISSRPSWLGSQASTG